MLQIIFVVVIHEDINTTLRKILIQHCDRTTVTSPDLYCGSGVSIAGSAAATVGFNWVCPIYSAIKSKEILRLKLMLGVICWVLYAV